MEEPSIGGRQPAACTYVELLQTVHWLRANVDGLPKERLASATRLCLAVQEEMAFRETNVAEIARRLRATPAEIMLDIERTTAPAAIDGRKLAAMSFAELEARRDSALDDLERRTDLDPEEDGAFDLPIALQGEMNRRVVRPGPPPTPEAILERIATQAASRFAAMATSAARH